MKLNLGFYTLKGNILYAAIGGLVFLMLLFLCCICKLRTWCKRKIFERYCKHQLEMGNMGFYCYVEYSKRRGAKGLTYGNIAPTRRQEELLF